MDLKEERNAVAAILKGYDFNINALDVKPASSGSSRNEILNGIKESDFIILIIGERYGSMDSRITNLNKLWSITRWEYEMAVKTHKKDVLVYFKKITSGDAIHYDDKLSGDYKNKRTLLQTFKAELSKRHNPKYFTTAEELAEEIRKAIISVYRTGVKSLLNKIDALNNEIDNLKVKNKQLLETAIKIEEIQSSGIVGGLLNAPGLVRPKKE